MMALTSHLPGTGDKLQLADSRAWVRFVVTIPCDPIGDDTVPAQLWPDIVKLLKDQPVMSPVNGLTRHVPGVLWTRLATNRAGTVPAVYAPTDQTNAIAAARLDLPDRYRPGLKAVLTLHFEAPRNSNPKLPVGPVAWTEYIKRALELPEALDGFLTRDLHLDTSGHEPVVLGFRFDAPEDLVEIIDITGLQVMPGGQHRRQAIGYFIADRDGVSARKVTERMMDDVLIYGLQAER